MTHELRVKEREKRSKAVIKYREMVCPKCNGARELREYDENNGSCISIIFCQRCNGAGYIQVEDCNFWGCQKLKQFKTKLRYVK